jgi:hypothetical protein
MRDFLAGVFQYSGTSTSKSMRIPKTTGSLLCDRCLCRDVYVLVSQTFSLWFEWGLPRLHFESKIERNKDGVVPDRSVSKSNLEKSRGAVEAVGLMGREHGQELNEPVFRRLYCGGCFETASEMFLMPIISLNSGRLR